MAFGFPFAVLGLVLVIVKARFRYPKELLNFDGYPMTLSSLWLPGISLLRSIRAYFPASYFNPGCDCAVCTGRQLYWALFAQWI